MLSFGLKIAWFVLSLTGLVLSWTVLLTFSRVVGSYWGPVLYCIGCTMLQGIFCIGMAWRMDPFLMPRSFCIAQSIITGFSSFFLTGVCTAFSLATSICVIKSSGLRSIDSSKPLAWRHSYLIPILLFPILATAAQLAVTLKLDAVRPSDGLTCDATHPIWVRFIGYAGIPFILGIPCFCVSVLSIVRALKIHRKAQIARSLATHKTTNSNLTSIPIRRGQRRKTDISPPAQSSASPHRAPIRPGLCSPVLSSKKFHLPFSQPHYPSRMSSQSSMAPDLDEQDDSLSFSSGFPTFRIGQNSDEIPEPGSYDEDGNYRPNNQERAYSDTEYSTAEGREDRITSLQWAIQVEDRHESHRNSKIEYEFDHTSEEPDIDGDYIVLDYPNTGQKDPASPSIYVPQRFPPNITAAVWRIIVFQLTFVSILILASVSTIIDVVAHHPFPSPFGTQHVAIILAAWGPVIVFSYILPVRRSLTCCRRS